MKSVSVVSLSTGGCHEKLSGGSERKSQCLATYDIFMLCATSPRVISLYNVLHTSTSTMPKCVRISHNDDHGAWDTASKEKKHHHSLAKAGTGLMRLSQSEASRVKHYLHTGFFDFTTAINGIPRVPRKALETSAAPWLSEGK